MKKILLFCLIGVALAGLGIPLAQKLAAQSSSSPQTRILLPWYTGGDAGYTSLLQVENTSMDPYGTTAQSGTCNADFYYNGTHFGPGSLGTFAAGMDTTITQSQIETATGVDLANSGQRGYMFLTCNFKFAHAQVLFVNPGGVVTFFNGYIIPPNRALGTGPEQLLQ